jgi:hypothetical protein
MTLIYCGILFFSQGQENFHGISNNDYFRLISGSANSEFNRVELFSDIDTTWQY